MITVENATKEIKGKVVLENISLHMKSGTCSILRGHNGCGKTMLLRLLCGLIRPTSGQVFYGVENPRFGVIIENPAFLNEESAEYNLTFLANLNKFIQKNEIDVWLKRFELYDVRKQKVKTFSLGMKQRLALIQAVMEDPGILLLDEPFNALDERNLSKAIDLIAELKKKGKLIVIASHGNPLEGTGFVDQEILMENGRVIGRNHCKKT